MQGAPQTAHGFEGVGRSASTDFLAISKISGEMIGSAIGFFFIVDFTIEQISGIQVKAYVPELSRYLSTSLPRVCSA